LSDGHDISGGKKIENQGFFLSPGKSDGGRKKERVSEKEEMKVLAEVDLLMSTQRTHSHRFVA
jgi:hypothetical protein